MSRKILKTTILYFLIPFFTSVLSGLVVLSYQSVKNFQNTLFFLAAEVQQTQSTLVNFAAKETLEIPLSENQVPNKYWNTLGGDELDDIYNCDNKQSVQTFYQALDVLKAEYGILFTLAASNKNPAFKMATEINNQESAVLNFSKIALSSVDGCNRSLAKLFMHELKEILKAEKVKL